MASRLTRLLWPERMALAAYAALMSVATPLLRLKLWRRAQREPAYATQVHERFARYEAAAPPPGCVWVHAVSLGETRAAAVLLRELRALHPGVPVLLTHGTATGRAQGEGLLQPGDMQAWLPWDTPSAVRRFLAHFRPRVGVLMETEVWPALVQGCADAGVPLVLANARLNARSFGRAQRLAWLSGPAYRHLSAVLAQGDDDAQRLAALGAPVSGVFGNLKFDIEADAAQAAVGRGWRARVAPASAKTPPARPVVMLASSREGEEALWLQGVADAVAHGASAGHPPLSDGLWLVVPRHPQRFDEVHRLLTDAGWWVTRRSALNDDATVPSEGGRSNAPQALLGDSVGEMQAYYAMADVALLGGSFAPLGGQNLIEALACGCPVVMGPHTFNFADAARQAVECGAAWQEADLPQALRRVQWLLGTEQGRVALVQARRTGLELVAAGRGAARKQAQAIADAAAVAAVRPLSVPPAS